jgi:uncharacterized protein YcbX
VHLSRIILYPIKSLDGVGRREARITPGGILEHDRAYAIVDEAGKPVNGKRNARIHLLRSAFDEEMRTVALWEQGHSARSEFGLDERSGLDRWLSEFFGFAATVRHEPRSGFPDDSDAFGPTVVAEASLAAVASWFPGLDLEGARRRFRANLEIDGGPAFSEDALYGAPGELRPFGIGPVEFWGHNPCQRCVVPTRDPETGEGLAGFQKKFMEARRLTLPTWADARRFNHYYRLTVNTSIRPSEAGKTLRVGDVVRAQMPVAERAPNAPIPDEAQA